MEKEVRKELIKNLRNYEVLLDSAARIQDFPDNKFQDLFNKKTEGMSLLNKNLLLKEMLSDYLKGSYEKQVVNFWIINKWGGIPWKSNTDNQARITKFSKELADQKNLMYSDNAISSISKVMSFVNPQEYFIYDSRAIFSLNWLLKISGESKRFFCQPKQKGGATRVDGSKRIVCYDLSKIITDELNEKGIDINIPKKVTIQDYLEYCKLIKDIYLDVFMEDKSKDIKQPYKLEMLLFWIAPTKILAEVDAQYKGTIYDKSLTSNSTNDEQQSPKNKSTTKKKPTHDILNRFKSFCQKTLGKGKDDYYIVIGDKQLGLRTNIFAKELKYRKEIAYQSFSIIGYKNAPNKDTIKLALDNEFTKELSKTVNYKEVNDFLVIYNYNPKCLKNGKLNEEELIKWFNAHAKNLVKIINDNK